MEEYKKSYLIGYVVTLCLSSFHHGSPSLPTSL